MAGHLAMLMGIFTLGFAGVQNYPQVVVLRFFIGVFEAGFFPGGWPASAVFVPTMKLKRDAI